MNKVKDILCFVKDVFFYIATLLLFFLQSKLFRHIKIRSVYSFLHLLFWYFSLKKHFLKLKNKHLKTINTIILKPKIINKYKKHTQNHN